MPSDGQHAFLPCTDDENVVSIEVSMPSNGQHAFLQQRKKAAGKERDVSMPSNGQHSFLPGTRFSGRAIWSCVNALKRATRISTTIGHSSGTCCVCVNALKRATRISTSNYSINWCMDRLVSMPSNGQHAFLLGELWLHCHEQRCVNALKRATRISTVPPQEPLFYKAS